MRSSAAFLAAERPPFFLSDHDKSRIFHSILIKDCARLIGRAVVNCKDGEVGICLRQNRIKAFAEIQGDVVDRDDDCYFWLVINVGWWGGGTS